MKYTDTLVYIPAYGVLLYTVYTVYYSILIYLKSWTMYIILYTSICYSLQYTMYTILYTIY